MCGEGSVRGVGRQSVGIPSLFFFWDSSTIFRVHGCLASPFWFSKSERLQLSPRAPSLLCAPWTAISPKLKLQEQEVHLPSPILPVKVHFLPELLASVPSSLTGGECSLSSDFGSLAELLCFPCVLWGSLRRRHTVEIPLWLFPSGIPLLSSALRLPQLYF